MNFVDTKTALTAAFSHLRMEPSINTFFYYFAALLSEFSQL